MNERLPSGTFEAKPSRHQSELAALHQRLTAHLIVYPQFDSIFAGSQIARLNQTRQGQPISVGLGAAPILRLFSQFFAVFYQRLLDIDCRPQGRLIYAGVIDLQVDADRRSSMKGARNIGNYFLIADHELMRARGVA